MTPHDRDIARAEFRRFALAELTPAELDAESDRWLHHLALLRGDLKAHDFSELPEATILAGIAYAEHRLDEITTQLRRYVRARQTGKVGLTADFRAIKYVDLVGLAETLTSQRAVKSGSRHRIVCPFHDDTRPSLVIYPPGGGWWCPVCNTGGQDAASFCAELFACSQVEGLRIVEQMADGVRVA
jgi:hypothetical protein